jgi:hypothetical protein
MRFVVVSQVGSRKTGERGEREALVARTVRCDDDIGIGGLDRHSEAHTLSFIYEGPMLICKMF